MKVRSMRQALKPLKSASVRSKVIQEARRLGFTFKGMNDMDRKVLADAVFFVMNEIEHRHAGKPGAHQAPHRCGPASHHE